MGVPKFVMMENLMLRCFAESACALFLLRKKLRCSKCRGDGGECSCYYINDEQVLVKTINPIIDVILTMDICSNAVKYAADEGISREQVVTFLSQNNCIQRVNSDPALKKQLFEYMMDILGRDEVD